MVKKILLAWCMMMWCLGNAGAAQADTWTPKWTFQTGNIVLSSPAIGPDGTIYVGSMDRKIYALNPDGTKKWAYDTASDFAAEVYSSPSVGPDGTIYVASAAFLYALNPNGTKKWTFMPDFPLITSSPALAADGTIYIFSRGDGTLYAVNPNGTKKWSLAMGLTATSWLDSSPAVGQDGTIYVGNNLSNEVLAINADGTRKWAFKSGNGVFSSPAVGPDGAIYVGSVDKKLYALYPDGTQKWAFPCTGAVLASPAIGPDGAIYVGDEGKLYAINPDGTERWSYAGPYWQQASSPAIDAQGTVYSGAYALTAGGALKWYYDKDPVVDSSPAIGPDGTLYVGSGDHNIYAFDTGSQGLSASPWPMFRHDSRHTGRVGQWSPPGALIVPITTLLLSN